MTTTTMATAPGEEPGSGLRAVRSLHELADRLEALQVTRARDRGWSWRQIAELAGTRRHRLRKRHRSAGRRLLL